MSAKPSTFTNTAPTSETADFIPYTLDKTGTPSDKTMSLRQLFTALNLLTTITDIDSDSGDYIAVYQANGTVAKKITVDNYFKGIQDVYIPVSAMWPRTTSGPATLAKTELATNKANIQSLDFDASTIEYAQFIWKLPRQYDGSTITFVPDWTAASGSGDVIWQISARAYANDDALDQASGTAQTSTDTLITANDQHEGPASSAITIAGSPAGGQLIIVEVSRKASDAGDTLAVDAKLLGITLRIGVNKKASA